MGHSARVQSLLFSPPLTSPRPSYLSRINTASCKCCTSGPSPWNNYSIAYFLKKSIELFRRCTSKFIFCQIYANIHPYSPIIHSFPYTYARLYIIYYIIYYARVKFMHQMYNYATPRHMRQIYAAVKFS